MPARRADRHTRRQNRQRKPSAGFALRGCPLAPAPRRCGARSPLSSAASPHPAPAPHHRHTKSTAPPPYQDHRTAAIPRPPHRGQASVGPFVRKIYSRGTRNRRVSGIAFLESATHSRHATGTDPELAKEDEIPQQRVITTSPTRQEVIAADAHHSGRPLAARRRTTACADDGRHQN